MNIIKRRIVHVLVRLLQSLQTQIFLKIPLLVVPLFHTHRHAVLSDLFAKIPTKTRKQTKKLHWYLKVTVIVLFYRFFFVYCFRAVGLNVKKLWIKYLVTGAGKDMPSEYERKIIIVHYLRTFLNRLNTGHVSVVV
jgi:hypothetical protein